MNKNEKAVDAFIYRFNNFYSVNCIVSDNKLYSYNSVLSEIVDEKTVIYTDVANYSKTTKKLYNMLVSQLNTLGIKYIEKDSESVIERVYTKSYTKSHNTMNFNQVGEQIESFD
jgi:hypothetical protein